MDFTRHYSVASTASAASSSNGSVFGPSYSISSGKLLSSQLLTIPASSDERRHSRGDDGYFSPPVSRRTSEATKLPSIHELEKNLPSPPIPLPPSGSSPQKRESLSTVSSRNPISHSDQLAFPPKYPGTTISAIPKTRSNSHPQSNSPAFVPPPFPPTPSSQQYQGEPHSTAISRALGLSHQMMRLMKDYEMVCAFNPHFH